MPLLLQAGNGSLICLFLQLNPKISAQPRIPVTVYKAGSEIPFFYRLSIDMPVYSKTELYSRKKLKLLYKIMWQLKKRRLRKRKMNILNCARKCEGRRLSNI